MEPENFRSIFTNRKGLGKEPAGNLYINRDREREREATGFLRRKGFPGGITLCDVHQRKLVGVV